MAVGRDDSRRGAWSLPEDPLGTAAKEVGMEAEKDSEKADCQLSPILDQKASAPSCEHCRRPGAKAEDASEAHW